MTTTTKTQDTHKMKKHRTVVTVPNRPLVSTICLFGTVTIVKSIHLINICMTSHFPGLVQALQ
jgi:hypothetical protein